MKNFNTNGWIVGSSDGIRFRCWKDGNPAWTTDRAAATRYARRMDAEAVHAEDEAAWTLELFIPEEVLPVDNSGFSSGFAIYPLVDTAPAGYQKRVAAAHVALFAGDPTDVSERRDRNFEESCETAQAFEMTLEEAIALVKYTWGRSPGDRAKELGSQILTAFSLAQVAGIDGMEAAEADLEKLQRPETIERIRAKRATRHGRGPLPGFDPAVGAETSR